MAGGNDTRNHPNRSVTRLKSYGYVGEPSKGLPSGSHMQDDPGLTPVKVGSTAASPQKGYFPVVQNSTTKETTVDTANRKRTRFGASRQAKKNVRKGSGS